MPKHILFATTALVFALVASPAAQEDPLHPPPFLEPTTLFWTIRPDLSPNSLDLDLATALESDIFPHFVLGGSRRCSRESAARIHGAAPCVSFTPAIRIRMENAASAPIESPSFMPRLNMQWPFYGDITTANLGLHFGHHSNGQTECLFVWADGACANDGEFMPGDLASGIVRPDTSNGNFSLNYVKIAVDVARYTRTRTGEEERRVAGYRLSWSVEMTPDNWKYSSLRNGIYPTWKFYLIGGLAIANAPLCERADVFAEGTAYEFNSKLTGSFVTQLTCLWSHERGLGLFVKYSSGRDEYNSSFFIRGNQRLQFGFTVNRLRVFGADYW